jgi:uncharacterized protein (TIGR00730 family)
MNNIKTLTVYLGSSGYARPVFQQSAIDLGRIIGKKKLNLVYGGMDAGLMGLLASEALKAGAHVTGIIPSRLKDIERELAGLSESIFVDDLWDRKKRMFQRADAIITLPGGYGTMDESLEVLYWADLGLHSKPLILVNIEGYWDPFIAYLRTLLDFNPRFLVVVDKIEAVPGALSEWVPPGGTISAPDHLPHFEDEITRATKDSIIIDKASVENTYYGVCALGLKQLDRHQRHIGFLNTGGQFDLLMEALNRAEAEKFLTSYCLKLFDIDADEKILREKLTHQQDVSINLHREKWGERRKFRKEDE